ncbi:GGDEF domain-containing protein [Trinickia dabaoshanensis]|uniref:diguanylate cyclase n=1 Tax=Trinickia dabaoshanensis TaxID=564714 RepID=A0A2N7VMX1_9BURK|nr:GGDEF domain-containing protein [Trinickia dabaoshanensis]
MLNAPSTSRHRVIAAVLGLVLVLGAIFVWPLAGRQAAVVQAFLPMFGMAVFLTESLTAHLLYTQYSVSGRPVYAALSGAYLFAAISVAVQMLAFPGVFSPTGLLGAGAQSAVWIWVCWHGGFPTLVAASLALRRVFPRGSQRKVYKRLIGASLMGGAALIAAAASYLSIEHVTWLPDLIAGSSYRALADNPIAVAVVCINAGTFAGIVATTRLRTMLELWLAIALLAGSVDAVLTIHAGARYSVGWYAARIAAVCASSAVLGMLLREISHLYRNLHRAHESLIQSSLRDGLTKTFNRQYFDTQYPELLGVSANAGQPLSLLMIDIDYFKQYNDNFGHRAGDDCLQAVAAALQGGLRRPWDFVARFGGEEFVVVLPNCDSAAASGIAESLRRTVETLDISAPHSPAGRVTISIGAATSTAQMPAAPGDLVEQADRGLYRAKRAGRNRVEVCAA